MAARSEDSKGAAEQPSAPVPPEIFGLDGPFAAYFRSMNPFTWFQQGLDLYQNLFEIGLGTSKISPEKKDWRFQDETWTSNPFYQRLAQAYLAMTEAMEKMIPDELSTDDRARAQLATSIVTSTFAPTNTLFGNPAAIARSLETQGGSLAKGFENYLNDLIHNEGLPSQVDDSSFEVGGNLAVTPGKVVHKTEMYELIQYRPTTESVHELPVLVVPPQIGRFYFIDLSPGRSFAEYALSQGLQCFAISWRNPTPDQRDWGFEDYLSSALEAVETVATITGRPKVNVLGFCAGGILASILAAYLAAKKRDLVNTLTLCVTMLNFQTDASIGAFRFPAMLSVAKAQSAMKGVLPGADLHKVFTWLRPNDLVWNYWVNNYLMGETPSSFDILAWNKDNSNLTAQLHSDFLQLFDENKLIVPCGRAALGEAVDLTRISCDNFIVGAVTDHLTPWKGCFLSTGYLGGQSTFALSNGGHVAALVNPPENPKAFHWVGPAKGEDPDDWLAATPRRPGSWWTAWTGWCAARSGSLVAAPQKLGNKSYKPIIDAPGEYVVQ